MKLQAKNLIQSFMTQAKWGSKAEDGRPHLGVKWLTQKQRIFLESLMNREKINIEYFIVDGYRIELGKTSPINNCAQIKFLNTTHYK